MLKQLRLRVAFMVMFALMFALPSYATGTVDSATVDLVDGIKLTAMAIIALATVVVTAKHGLRLYNKMGGRVIRSS